MICNKDGLIVKVHDDDVYIVTDADNTVNVYNKYTDAWLGVLPTPSAPLVRK